jgi:hypothetical protein
MELENLNYEQLKQLSDEEKKNVLEELQGKYGSNMEIAKHLSIAPIVISNLVKRLITGEKVGRNKKPALIIDEEIKPEAQEAQPVQLQVVPETKLKRPYTRKPKETVVFLKEEEKVIEVKMADIKTHKFIIELNDELEGQEVKERLSGLVGVISLNKKYEIEIKVTEV